ncbi:MAG TPA: hypothetical protein VGF56_04050 [Rhizomicrobium sp.]
MNSAPDIAFACVLGLAALLAVIVSRRARAAARDYLAFAAALYGALAIGDLLAITTVTSAFFADAVTLTIGALAPCALALALAGAFGRAPPGWIVAPAMLISAAAGIMAAATGMTFVAFAPLFACLCAMLALAARHASLYALLTALALLAAAASFMTEDGRTAFALFSAAGLMGAARVSAARVEEKRRPGGRGLAVAQRR